MNWQGAEYVFYRSLATLRSEATKTYLSVVWWVLEPTLLMLIYYFVFAIVLDRFTEDFVPFLLIGLIVWQFFAATVTNASSSISSQWGLMQRVYINKLVFPSISVLADFYRFVFVLLVLSAFTLLYGFPATEAIVWMPLVLVAHLLFVNGVAFLLAAIVPVVPDLRILIANFMRVGLYVSGVLYPASSVPETLRPYFYWNPMVGVIESYRDVFMYNSPPDLQHLGYAGGIGLVLFALGVCAILHWNRQYPKVSVR